MARAKSSNRQDATAKIDSKLLEMARMVALHRKTTVAELISGLLKEPIEQSYADMIKDLTK